jgi:hypothetical protein
MPGIEAAGGQPAERQPTDRCVESAGRLAQESIGPFRRVASRVAAVRRRDDCLRVVPDHRQTEECD